MPSCPYNAKVNKPTPLTVNTVFNQTLYPPQPLRVIVEVGGYGTVQLTVGGSNLTGVVKSTDYTAV
jgi:hypothetical protein